MLWKSIQLPPNAKIFKVHTFYYMSSGRTYLLEVDEYNDGTYTGHGEQTNDDSNVLSSVTGATIEECIEALVKKIKAKG